MDSIAQFVSIYNAIQGAWLRFNHATQGESRFAMLNLMRQLPKDYLVAHGGDRWSVVKDGNPFTVPNVRTLAEEIAAKHGVQISVAWNVELGVWFSIAH